jgi:hypothetical protein
MAMGGLAMMVPPFLGSPSSSDNNRQRLTDLAADPTTALARSLIFQLSVLLLISGVVAIVGRTRGRGSAAVVSGGVVYGAGLVGAFTFMVMTGVEVALAGDGAINQTLVDAADRMESSPAAMPAGVLAILLFHLVGLPWLTFGMVRARQIPLWLAIAATVGTGCAFFGSGTRVETVGWVLVGLTLIGIAATVIRPSLLTPSPAVPAPRAAGSVLAADR